MSRCASSNYRSALQKFAFERTAIKVSFSRGIMFHETRGPAHWVLDTHVLHVLIHWNNNDELESIIRFGATQWLHHFISHISFIARIYSWHNVHSIPSRLVALDGIKFSRTWRGKCWNCSFPCFIRLLFDVLLNKRTSFRSPYQSERIAEYTKRRMHQNQTHWMHSMNYITLSDDFMVFNKYIVIPCDNI